MNREMEMSAEYQRLQALYAAMADGELVELAERPEELTELAGEVLAKEVARRGLEVEAEDVEESEHVLFGSSGEFDPATAVELMTFYDAVQAGDALRHLDAAGVPFQIVDRAVDKAGFRSADGPSVALQLNVGSADRPGAMAVLRREMGLFPLQEVEHADELTDDGSLAVLGEFGTRDEAEEIGGWLGEAGVWFRVSEDEGREEFPFQVQVKEVDLDPALEVVERGMAG